MEHSHSAIWLIMRFIICGIIFGKINAKSASTINPPLNAPNILMKKILFVLMVKL
jgi:hypothetical protein